jgi:polysaccharide export outer membrane protein
MGPTTVTSTAGALEQPAEALKALKLEFEGNEARAVIQADGKLEHRVYLLEDPPQLVLDILYVRNPLKAREPDSPHSLLERVRCQELPMSAYVEGEQEKTFGRLIFDLKHRAQYWIRVEPGSITVGLFPREGEAIAVDDDGNDVEIEPDETATEEPEPDPESNPETGNTSEYRIEPEDVDPDVFFGPALANLEQYPLGPEDVVEIRVFELEQLHRTVRVQADGNIELPLIGLIRVQGLTTMQVAERVAGKLGNRYVQNPQVSVLITEFNSRKVSLLGSVAKPATYPLAGRRNLLQLLADAGGLSADAGGVLYVFRPLPDGRSARLTVPLNELLIKGDPRWNIWINSGDIISVPPEKAISVSVLGAVRNPGIYKLPVGEGSSLLRAIAQAGGLNDRASKSGIQIKRSGDDGTETILKVDLGKILAGDKPDVVLQEGDVIVVKESFF